MARYTIVVDRLDDWLWSKEGIRLITVDTFLEVKSHFQLKRTDSRESVSPLLRAA